MSTKRKRLSEAVENSPPVGTPALKKRKGRFSYAEKTKITEELKKARGVFNVLKQHRGEENREITEHFLRTPSRRTEPEYYKQVKSPIDLTRIQQKLKTEEYHTFEQFCKDVELLVENTRSYYKAETEEHRDAIALMKIYQEAKEKVENGIPLVTDEKDEEDIESNGGSSVEAKSISSGGGAGPSREVTASPENLESIYIDDILCAMLEYTDSSGKLISPPFKILQTKEDIPDYYDKIKNPIDLKTIAEKARAGEYKVLSDLDADVRLLCKNAQLYGGKGSQIYKDASTLLEYFKEKSAQVLEKGVHVKRREKVVRVVDGLLAELPPTGDYSEDSEEDEFDEKTADSKWKLYWALRDKLDDSGTAGSFLCYPFLELPSRVDYPDYYDEIKHPISFYMINKRLKRGEYKGLMELVDDFMQVFQNACEYNMENSEYYISATKLECLTVSKARELDPSLDLSNYEQRLQYLPPTTKATKASKLKAELDTSDDEGKGTPPPKRKPRSPKKTDTPAQPGKPGRKSLDELFTRFRSNLIAVWSVAHDYKDKNGYWPGSLFIELPSKKEYPDYYDVIKHPLDLTMIREKIETNKYDSSIQLVADLKQMFENAKEYNEPGSKIYNDAQRLEELVISHHAKMKDSPFENPIKNKIGQNSLSGKTPKLLFKGSDKKLEEMINRLPPDQQRMWRLFNYMKDYRDEEGRKLSTPFFKLPTREEYPNYYEVIKKPMDLQRIQQRLNGMGYSSWVDMVTDLSLMLDNACKYNETDSTIYKDAVSLQRVLLEKKMELGASDDTMPRVQVEIRSLFTNIFHNVFTKKDREGRCYSDSFNELPDILKAKGIPAEEWPFSFEQIKRNIEKCRYRRLDRFQKDFFDLFERAREFAKLGSKLFEDATELQLLFIQERDTLCKNVLVSDAFAVIKNNIVEESEKMRKRRLQAGEPLEADRRESTDDIANQDGEVDLASITVNNVEYSAPCYAYISRTDENTKGLPHIMRIERIFKNDSGDEMVRGCWVYRPSETLHLPNRKFIENEVFITPFQDVACADRLLGKCLVLYLKTYLANTVEGFEEKDVYICESKYLGKPRYFVKSKTWMYPEEEEKLKMQPRERAISPVRVASEFVKTEPEDQSSVTSSSSTEEDDRLRDYVFLDIDRPEVPVKNGEADADGRMYFLQMRTKAGKHYACGDFVLVFNPNKHYCDVMRIDKLWRDKDGSEWFSGGWFARPSDIKHDSGRLFYRREVFAVNQPDQTRRIDDIQNHCAVLIAKDYVRERPTEIPECDVFICEHRINGMALPKGEFSCLFTHYANANQTNEEVHEEANPSGEPMIIDFISPVRRLKTYKNGALVVDAELFRFKTPIIMEKEMSPLLKNDIAVPLDPLDIDMLDDNESDGAESSVSNKPEMNNWLAAQPKLTAKSKSGYILFSAEIRKRIMHENPEAGFGEVSKIVGIEWKKLSEDQKRQYEVRAEYIANERAKQEAARALVKDQLQPGQIRVYQCRWQQCDSQFDQENGLYEHIVQHHTSQIILDSENQYVCMWYTCVRNRKDGKPFPSLPRLHRHMKEKHLGNSGRSVYQNQIGRNFFKLVSTPSSNGETYQLVHVPFGRTAAPPNQQPVHHAQPALVNGHVPAHQVNGEHFQGPVQQVAHPAQSHPQGVYVAQPSSSHFVPQHAPQPAPNAQSTPHPQPIGDPGRTVVKRIPAAEPVFIHAPASFAARRVLHSETYIRYIESLGSNRQRSVSQYDRTIAANPRNTQPSNKPLPVHWIRQRNGRDIVSEDDVIKALWKMREQIMESSIGISLNKAL